MGKKILALVDENYEDLELLYPVIRLREEGYEVVIAGDEAGKLYTGKHGYPVTSDADFRKINPDDFEGIIVPGGGAPDRLRRHEEITRILRNLDARGKTIATICHAGHVLVTADLLKGRKITSFFAIRPEMEFAGGIWSDESVVVDGNFVSSRTPADLPDFMREVIKNIG